MKIVVVVSDPTSGLLQYPVDLALRFEALGHEVVVLSWTTKGQNPDLYDRIMSSCMTYLTETSLQYPFGLLGFKKGLLSKIDPSFVKADLLLTFGPFTAWQARSYLKKGGVSLSMIAAMGHDRTSWWKPLLGAQLLNLYTTHVGALCHLEIKRLTSLGVKPEKIVLVHNWIDLDRLTYQTKDLISGSRNQVIEKLDLNPQQKIVVCLASFQLRKRQDLLITAFSKMIGSYPNYDLVLAGDGAERHNCEQLVLKLGLIDRVHFVGQLANDDAMSLLSISDVVVHCSNAETFGYSMVEPLFLEKPTLVTRVGVAWEMETAEVAEVVPPDDIDALTLGLGRVMGGGQLIEQRVKRSRKFVSDNFEVNKIAKQILSLAKA